MKKCYNRKTGSLGFGRFGERFEDDERKYLGVRYYQIRGDFIIKSHNKSQFFISKGDRFNKKKEPLQIVNSFEQ